MSEKQKQEINVLEGRPAWKERKPPKGFASCYELNLTSGAASFCGWVCVPTTNRKAGVVGSWQWEFPAGQFFDEVVDKFDSLESALDAVDAASANPLWRVR